MATYYEVDKSQFQARMDVLSSGCASHALELGHDATILAEITGAMAEVQATFASQVTARAALIGATAASDDVWRLATAVAAKYNPVFQAMPDLSPELIASLGLKLPSRRRTAVPLRRPKDLSAFGSSNGTNSLRWDRNGSGRGAVYVIDSAYDGSGDREVVDIATRPKYEHRRQTPDRAVVYRVYTQRGQPKSGPSGTASVYDLPSTPVAVAA